MESTVISIEALNTVGQSCLPGLLGIEVLKGEPGIHENRLASLVPLHATLAVSEGLTSVGFDQGMNVWMVWLSVLTT